MIACAWSAETDRETTVARITDTLRGAPFHDLPLPGKHKRGEKIVPARRGNSAPEMTLAVLPTGVARLVPGFSTVPGGCFAQLGDEICLAAHGNTSSAKKVQAGTAALRYEKD
jgi:hypothetical protein